jgi:hypothetical protein
MSKNVSPHKKKVSQQECADVVISKIIFHSRNGVSSKLLKYLLHAKRMFTSSDLRLWMELRKKGGLEAIQTVVRTLIVEAESTNTTTEATKNDLIGKAMMTKEVQKKGAKTDGSSFCSCKFKLSSVQKDVCVASLSILGNAFSLDYAARKEVLKDLDLKIINCIRFQFTERLSLSFVCHTGSVQRIHGSIAQIYSEVPSISSNLRVSSAVLL